MEPMNLKYSKDHLWISEDGGNAHMGVTDHAQKEMGDVVFLELSEPGKSFEQGDVIGNIESVKAASDIVAPVSGEIVAVNGALTDSPDTLNTDPYGEGWIYTIKVKNRDELDSLMDYEAYTEFATNQ